MCMGYVYECVCMVVYGCVRLWGHFYAQNTFMGRSHKGVLGVKKVPINGRNFYEDITEKKRKEVEKKEEGKIPVIWYLGYRCIEVC